MKGGVRKRGDKWYYYFDAGTINGKRNRIERVGGRTKKQAEAALAKAINEYNTAGIIFEPSTMTLSDYLDYWTETYLPLNCKQNTIDNYKCIIERVIQPQLGKYRLCAISTPVIQQWVNDLAGKGLAHGTISQYRTLLSGAFNYAVQPLQYIQYNPCLAVRIPKSKSASGRKRSVIPLSDFEVISERFEGSPHYLPIMIGFYTGLRLGEVFALTWDDIDLDARTITVCKTASRVRLATNGEPPWYLSSPKTESSNRVVKFGNALEQILREARRKKAESRIKKGGEYIEIYAEDIPSISGIKVSRLVCHKRCEPCDLPASDMVCVRSSGKYNTPAALQAACRRATTDTGIHFEFHALRHTHATMLIEGGASVKSVQERLGHSTSKLTMDIYSHSTDRQRDEAVEIFERAVK